mgnify:CR=1 FL=1
MLLAAAVPERTRPVARIGEAVHQRLVKLAVRTSEVDVARLGRNRFPIDDCAFFDASQMATSAMTSQLAAVGPHQRHKHEAQWMKPRLALGVVGYAMWLRPTRVSAWPASPRDERATSAPL